MTKAVWQYGGGGKTTETVQAVMNELPSGPLTNEEMDAARGRMAVESFVMIGRVFNRIKTIGMLAWHLFERKKY